MKENMFGMPIEEIKKQCRTKNLEGDLTQAPIVKGETLEPCIRGSKKISENPETLKLVREILTNSACDLTLDKLKSEYDIREDEIVIRLCEIKLAIEEQKQKNMNYDELISFLKSAMNYGDMQIWLLDNQMNEINLTLNDELKKFFELKTNEDILRLYDLEQNYNQNNIDNIRKLEKTVF